MKLKQIMLTILGEYLNENFKPMPIDTEISDFILDWKQLTINNVNYDFLRLNGVDKHKFVIEVDGVGEIGRAILNCYDTKFDGCYLDKIEIESKYRRIGLGTKLYEYIEELIGEKLHESPNKQSNKIKQFWNKRNV